MNAQNPYNGMFFDPELLAMLAMLAASMPIVSAETIEARPIDGGEPITLHLAESFSGVVLVAMDVEGELSQAVEVDCPGGDHTHRFELCYPGADHYHLVG